MICVLILDFDGVVAESLPVKAEAFRKLFAFAPEHISSIIDFHRANGGLNRFEKIRFIYKNILQQELSEERFAELSRTYATLVVDGVIRSPLVAGAEEFFAEFCTEIPIYISSATPEEEMRHIVRARGIDRCFRAVYGAPRPKEEAIREIIEAEGARPETVVFVGDAVNDLRAARAAGVRFIGRLLADEPDRLSGLPGVEAVVHDLRELAVVVRGARCW
jgi:HAD superfamily hydrolase (TIGR01549 family)